MTSSSWRSGQPPLRFPGQYYNVHRYYDPAQFLGGGVPPSAIIRLHPR